MNSQICVNCRNEKTVNSTDNRLVTESCGHIKCMDCLLHEKSGCSACLREKTAKQLKEPEKEELCVSDSGPEDADLPLIYEKDGNESLLILYDELGKRKKPETSHIRIEQDANGKSYMCTVCKKKFNARSQVWYHAYCNGQRKPFQCPECNKSFASHSHFKYHMRVHRNERTYACEVCGDSFFQMSKLQRHKLKHTKEKKFSCVQCDKAFTNLSSLRKHELTHSEARPFACGICSRRFRDSSNYKKHVAKHEDKKCTCGGGCSLCMSSGASLELRAHQCPRCPRAFHSRKDMRRHAAVHTDSKPFRCKVCGRRFRRKDNLERHIRNTHPDYVPASAVDCDVSALKQLAANGHASPDTPKSPQVNEKSMLKILNPLPPLPADVIQNAIHMCNRNENGKDEKKGIIDKSYILEANNARQSVIVGKFTFERKSPSPQGNEYVHKIRKANSMACQKNIPLPPIDEKKIIELERNTSLNKLDVGAPPKDVELYKKILYEKSEMYDKSELYEKSEIDSVTHDEEKTRAPASGPEMHWRRKMKLNINW